MSENLLGVITEHSSDATYTLWENQSSPAMIILGSTAALHP